MLDRLPKVAAGATATTATVRANAVYSSRARWPSSACFSPGYQRPLSAQTAPCRPRRTGARQRPYAACLIDPRAYSTVDSYFRCCACHVTAPGRSNLTSGAMARCHLGGLGVRLPIAHRRLRDRTIACPAGRNVMLCCQTACGMQGAAAAASRPSPQGGTAGYS